MTPGRPHDRSAAAPSDGLPDLDDRLRRLADRVATPLAPVGDDLARGRRRLRRRRLAVTGAALATVVAVGLGAALAPGAVDRAQGPDLAGDTDAPTPRPTPEPTPTPPPAGPELGSPRPVPWGVPEPRDPFALAPEHDEALDAWQRVLAEHLDPDWAHLVRREPDNANQQTTGGPAGLVGLGSKYAWRNAGEAGLGMLQVGVHQGWGAAMFPCRGRGEEGWTCRAAEAPGAAQAWVAERDGVLAVAVERADDGQVVALTADPLFGNNSQVPVSGLGLDADALLAAAADPRLALPGVGEAAPPLDQAAFEAVGQRLVGDDGELSASPRGLAGAPAWRGSWRVDHRSVGVLDWSAVPTHGEPAELVCLRQRFERCQALTVDGAEVFVGRVRERWGGGFEVSHAGPVYDVRVVFTPHGDVSLPVERAYEVVADPRWQPRG